MTDSSAHRRSGIGIGANFSIDTRTNAYTLDQLIDERFDQPLLRAKKPFATADGSLEVHLKERGCSLGVEKHFRGAATTTKDTLRAYKGFETNGFEVSSTESVSLRFKSMSWSGSGVNYGCASEPSAQQRLRLVFRWLKLDGFDAKTYAGRLSGGQTGTTVLLREERYAIKPMFSLLQTAGEGEYFGLDLQWAGELLGERLSHRLEVKNLINSIRLKNAPFITRQIDAIVNEGDVVQRNRVSPLSGRYGNKDATFTAPLMWSAQTHYKINAPLSLGVDVHGVNSTHQVLAVGQWACASLCGQGNKLRFEADTEGTTVAIGYETKSFSVGLGFAVGSSLGVKSINQLRLRIQI